MKLMYIQSLFLAIFLVSCKGVDNSFVASSFQAPSECPIDTCIDQTINPRAMYASTLEKEYAAKTNQSRIEISGQCEMSNVNDSEVLVKFGNQILNPFVSYAIEYATGKISTLSDISQKLNAGRNRFKIDQNSQTNDNSTVYLRIELLDFQDQIAKSSGGAKIRCRNGQFRFLVDVRALPWGIKVDLSTELLGRDANMMEIRSLNSPTIFSIYKDQFCVGRLAFANIANSTIYYNDPDNGNCVLNYTGTTGLISKWFQF
jgi:hypothetical protein